MENTAFKDALTEALDTKAKEAIAELKDSVELTTEAVKKGDVVTVKKFGKGIVLSISKKSAEVGFDKGPQTVKLSDIK